MTTTTNIQPEQNTSQRIANRQQVLKNGRNGAILSTETFGTSLVERISTVFAGLGLSVAFGLTGTILALALRT